jgi:hypothetical protein
MEKKPSELPFINDNPPADDKRCQEPFPGKNHESNAS